MKKILGMKSDFRDYILIIIGTCIMSAVIKSVFATEGMVTGGFSGFAIVLKYWTKNLFNGGIPLWFTNLALNLPLFFIAWKIKGFDFVKRAILGDLSLTFWLAVQPVFPVAAGDILLSAVFGGFIEGIGIGLVFLGQGTTGGTDMLSAIIQRFIPHYSIAQIMQFVDGCVVLLGMYVFGVHKALYAIIAVFLITKVTDGIIEGVKFSKQAYIITNKPDEIAKMVMEEVGRGVTGLPAKGMFSGQERVMLYCVVNKKEIVLLKEKVDEIDPNAFMIVSDAREVHGEGFIEKARTKKLTN